MPRHVYTLVAQRVIVDGQKNLTTLVDLVEDLTMTGGVPSGEEGKAVLSAPLELVSYWAREDDNEPESASVRIRIVAPDAKTGIGTLKATMNLEAHENGRIVGSLPPLPFRGFGQYEFITEVQLPSGRWKPVHRLPIRVKDGRPPASAH